MQLCKVRLKSGDIQVAALERDQVQLLNVNHLGDVLHAEQPASALKAALGSRQLPLADVTVLPPVDQHEIWAAGVTYKRSQIARERESVGAARFYDLVYTAPRPELFFKATARRVVGPGHPVRVRRDSKWSVPEPELALVISPSLKLVGFTIGNDMSARDIEGENPLYLPQAKVYQHSCALGPAITLREDLPPLDQVEIRLTIQRGGKPVFEGTDILVQAGPHLRRSHRLAGPRQLLPGRRDPADGHRHCAAGRFQPDGRRSRRHRHQRHRPAGEPGGVKPHLHRAPISLQFRRPLPPDRKQP